MNEFERKLPSFRLAEIHHGDDLQTVADREMGDANRWHELVWINGLMPPYITDDPDRVRPGVLLSGSFIKVPAPAGFSTDGADRGQVYERDCLMTNRQLGVDDSGDLLVASGADNLRQQLAHRIMTPRGQARRHPEYGCLIYRLIGTVSGPVAGMLGAEYVKAAIKADYRVSDVDTAQAEIVGDAIHITARAVAIEGGIVDLQHSTNS